MRTLVGAGQGRSQRVGSGDGLTNRFDVFISYAWADHRAPRSTERSERAGAHKLFEKLKMLHLDVFLDTAEIDSFAPIESRIVEALGNSKVLVAWCSDLYITRRACAAELTLAAAASADEIPSRVMAINTEATAEHIPMMLLNDLVPQAPSVDDDAAFEDLADLIAQRCRLISSTFGASANPDTQTWYPEQPLFSRRFTGRFKDLWELHGVLIGSEFAGGGNARGAAVVHGMGGAGKTLLVQEYAYRFAGAWPGGVVWLRGNGYDTDIPDAQRSSDEIALRELSSLAITNLGIDEPGDSLLEVRAKIAKHFVDKGRVLWIVDDLAKQGNAASWKAPMPNGATVLTSRTGNFAGLFTEIVLDNLSREEAFQLLTAEHPPLSSEQAQAARDICELLGFHALAVDVTRSRISGIEAYEKQREIIRLGTAKALDNAAALFEIRGEQLANRHTPSVDATIMASIDVLSADGLRGLSYLAGFESVAVPNDVVKAIEIALGPPDRDQHATSVSMGLSLADLANHSLARCGDGDATLHRLVVEVARAKQIVHPDALASGIRAVVNLSSDSRISGEQQRIQQLESFAAAIGVNTFDLHYAIAFELERRLNELPTTSSFDDPRLETYAALGQMYWVTGRASESLGLLYGPISQLLEHRDSFDPLVGKLMYDRATAAKARGYSAMSIAHMETLFPQDTWSDHLSQAFALADLYESADRREDGIHFLSLLLEDCVKRFGSRDVRTLSLKARLALSHWTNAEGDLAADTLTDTIEQANEIGSLPRVALWQELLLRMSAYQG
jgi:hypothetical protein